MLKKLILAPIALLSLGFTMLRDAKPDKRMIPLSIYDIEIQSLAGKDTINLSDYKGKKILIVNVASECGYTYQYEDLEKLAVQYKDQLAVLGVPCNQFGQQEPGSDEDIQQFCSGTYGVSFPMTTKVDVVGENQHPLYTWLTSKEFNGDKDYQVKWNFNKFLISEEGKLLGYFGSGVKPFDDELINAIKS